MKSFFLVFLLLYLSLFPSASPVPLVEIVEEELVAHHLQVPVPEILVVPERKVLNEFPEQLTLKPQSIPGPELRPPERHSSLLG